MECSSVEFDDLPDEILVIILKKLSNSTVLYWLRDVNTRLNQLVYDPIFTNRLTLVEFVRNPMIESPVSSAGRFLVYPLTDPILERFCFQILPEISEQIQCLCLESISMERVLRATDYSNLTELCLLNIEAENIIELLSDETILTNQLDSLSIDIDTNGNEAKRLEKTLTVTLLKEILSRFSNLQRLNLNPSALSHQHLFFTMITEDVMSAILLELHICVATFNDCLRFLDGRFSQLRLFDVKIDHMSSSSEMSDQKTKLNRLRSFTLYSGGSFNGYEELILPLVHRMSNLEKLDLSIFISGRQTFLDGNELKLNILNHLPYLKEFSFNIRSTIYFDKQTNFLTNEDIQRTLTGFPCGNILCSVDHFPRNQFSQCHIYSSPYQMDYYDNLTNQFSGGFFRNVSYVTLLDEEPFEHTFFLRIVQSFPILETLIIINQKRQNGKGLHTNKDLSVIEYPCLRRLDLMEAHQDYHEQFLSQTKSCFPNGLNVTMNYQFVRKVTRNFRRNSTRKNCSKISFISFYKKMPYPEHMKDYFSCAEIH